jgi:energy-coupling factor transporter ATP-binding protein EcfA2
MPSFDIVKSWVPEETFRTAAVKASFTLEDITLQKRFAGEIPLEGLDWKIGLIVGRSGTGKTSIAREKFPDAYIRSFEYSHKNFLADFPKENTVDEITTALCNVGFASPPDWLKSYDCLSQGEKMRVDIARALCTKMPLNPITGKELIVFDEFTSVVDREIAKIASFAISKSIKRSNKQFVAVTCHYDVEDWLEPDWVLYTDTMKFELRDKKKRTRPPIKLEIHECSRSLWSIFRQYHYLNTNILASNKHYVALYNSNPVAFISIGRSQYKYKYWRVSRLVVLPDYQGVGIGSRLLTWAAQHFHEKTRLDFFIVSSNPQLIHLRRSPHWILKRAGHSVNKNNRFRREKNLIKSSSQNRLTFSFKYKPETQNNHNKT